MKSSCDILKRLDFSANESWEVIREKNSWLSFIPETTKDDQGVIYLKGSSKKVVYKYLSEENKYICVDCNNEINVQKVGHPIWDGVFDCSGYGNVHYEDVPYCSNCEKTPSSSGTPIQI